MKTPVIVPSTVTKSDFFRTTWAGDIIRGLKLWSSEFPLCLRCSPPSVNSRVVAELTHVDRVLNSLSLLMRLFQSERASSKRGRNFKTAYDKHETQASKSNSRRTIAETHLLALRAGIENTSRANFTDTRRHPSPFNYRTDR